MRCAMETLELPVAEELADISHWDEEFDILAFELWQLASRPDPAAGEDCPDDPEALAGRASCL